MLDTAPWESFSALSAEGWLRHAFIQRVPGLDVSIDREMALARLENIHLRTIQNMGWHEKSLITAQQIHSANVVCVNAQTSSPVANCDGILTSDPAVILGIYVADCGAIYLADPVKRCLGLLHSGKKGTEQEILSHAIQMMKSEYGSNPADLIVQLGPCIRPPNYEIDFAASIAIQARSSGVIHFYDCGICTATTPETYYSYRREMGRTGRHLALLGFSH